MTVRVREMAHVKFYLTPLIFFQLAHIREPPKQLEGDIRTMVPDLKELRVLQLRWMSKQIISIRL